MKFNEITYILSFGILIITALYTLIYSGLTGLLLCSSVSLITAAFLDQFEIIVAITVLFSLFYIYFLKGLLRKFEPFSSNTGNSEDDDDTIKNVSQNSPFGISGVYDNKIEGFANVKGEENSEEEGESSSGSKASVNTGNEVNPVALDDISKAVDAVDKKSSTKKSSTDVSPKMDDKVEKFESINKEEFQSATNELFKLGKMPSEHKDGPLLDAGSTLLKAMSSFNPEQITAMSADTKQLLETQKNLMGMLNQMRPVLADGKELLSTFSGMFGN